MELEVAGKSFTCDYLETEIQSLGSVKKHKYSIQGEGENSYIYLDDNGDIIGFNIGNPDNPNALELESEIEVMFETKDGMNDLFELTFDKDVLRRALENTLSPEIDFSRYNQFTFARNHWGSCEAWWWEEREGILSDGGIQMKVFLYEFKSGSDIPGQKIRPDLKTNEWFTVKPIIYSFEVKNPFGVKLRDLDGRMSDKEYWKRWMPNEDQIAELIYEKIYEWNSLGSCPVEEIPRLKYDVKKPESLVVTSYDMHLCIKAEFAWDVLSKVNENGESKSWEDYYSKLYITVLIVI